MFSQVCVRMLMLVILGLHCACVGAGVLRRSTELAATTETVFRETPQPSSTSPPEQPESKNSTQAPTASEGRPEYACPLPWSGNTW